MLHSLAPAVLDPLSGYAGGYQRGIRRSDQSTIDGCRGKRGVDVSGAALKAAPEPDTDRLLCGHGSAEKVGACVLCGRDEPLPACPPFPSTREEDR